MSPSLTADAWVRMGIAHAHGLRGELKVVLDHDASTLDWSGLRVRLTSPDGREAVERRVVGQRRASSLAFLRLEGMADRDAAEAVGGFVVAVARADLPPLADDEVYLHDLVGLEVERGGARIGVVARVVVHPASSAIELELDGRRVEIPIHEPYVVEIDLRAGVVRVAHLEDLLEAEG